jgi:HAD superfamily hydrolase (TIGR01549 family)
MLKAFIFDIDGTLIDSVDHHARAWQDAFARWGKEIAFEDVRSQIGKGGDQLMPVFLSEEEIERFGEEMETWRGERFKERYLPDVRGFPRVPELFRRIRAEGYRIALASSAKADELERYLEIAGVEGMTDGETSSDDAERSKPHPDIFLAALEEVEGLSAHEALVVGDSPYDVQAAERAGCPCIAVRCGGFPENVLREAGALEIFEDPADILERFGEVVALLQKPDRPENESAEEKTGKIACGP